MEKAFSFFTAAMVDSSHVAELGDSPVESARESICEAGGSADESICEAGGSADISGESPADLIIPEFVASDEVEFSTHEEALQCVHLCGRQNGWAVFQQRSKNGNRTFEYCCTCEGDVAQYRGEKALTKNSSTRKCGCLFKLAVYCTGKDTSKWFIKVEEGEHVTSNRETAHGPSLTPNDHPLYRRQDIEKYAPEIDAMIGDGKGAKQIMNELRQVKDSREKVPFMTDPIMKDINNRIQKCKASQLGGAPNRTAAFLRALESTEGLGKVWFSRHRKDSEGRLNGIVLVPKAALNLARRNNQVYFSDSTYRTNVFEWPMHHIGGLTCHNTSVSFAFILMPGAEQKQSDYEWGLKMVKEIIFVNGVLPPEVWVTDRELAVVIALKKAFPNIQVMLDVWHIDKGVEAQARKYQQLRDVTQLVADDDGEQGDECNPQGFEVMTLAEFMAEWKQARRSRTEAEWITNKDTLCAKLTPRMGRYFAKEWFPYMENFVSCYVDRVAHLGCVVDSRIEGMHAQVKAHLTNSWKGDLYKLAEGLIKATVHQLEKARTAEGKDISTVDRRFREEAWLAQVIKRVSSHALGLLYSKLLKAQQSIKDNTELGACDGSFNKTRGVPCSHMIKKLLLDNKLLQPEDFHRHWRIDGSSAVSAAESALPPRQKLPKAKKRKAGVVAAVKIRRKTPNGRLLNAFDMQNQSNKVTENDT